MQGQQSLLGEIQELIKKHAERQEALLSPIRAALQVAEETVFKPQRELMESFRKAAEADLSQFRAAQEAIKAIQPLLQSQTLVQEAIKAIQPFLPIQSPAQKAIRELIQASNSSVSGIAKSI